MSFEVWDRDGHCFLLISSGGGAGDRESPLIGGGVSISRGGAAKGSHVRANRVGMQPTGGAKRSCGAPTIKIHSACWLAGRARILARPDVS